VLSALKRLPAYLIASVVFLMIASFYLWYGQSLAVRAETRLELIKQPWILAGANGAAEAYVFFDRSQAVLAGREELVITFNTHGACLLDRDASAIVFDQPVGRWNYVALADYGEPCFDGKQTVAIPLSDFKGLNPVQPVDNFHIRFWLPDQFIIEVTAVELVTAAGAGDRPGTVPGSGSGTKPGKKPGGQPGSEPTPTPAPSPTFMPSPTPDPANRLPGADDGYWEIRSVSTMKESKDRVCGPRTRSFIDQWMATAVDLGANYVAIETPYDDPACASALTYTREWTNSARAHGLRVWHRHMPLAFEGIYDTPKDPSKNYIAMITDYIRTNPELFMPGDIFTPTPEPQNGGVRHVTYCSQGVCQFDDAAHFNRWLREAIIESERAFADIGMAGQVRVGYYGFDGFVAWGSKNPDWNGILEDRTVEVMGNITIDHYPETIGDTMENALNELTARYPGVPIVIGEWGSIENRTNLIEQINSAMTAAMRPEVIGFNYWHMGMGGHEALIDENFNRFPHFETVREFFRN
jgi:hypothetical protein